MMNNDQPTPAALLGRLREAGPMRCLSRFLLKIRNAAESRGDIATVMEHECIRHFAAAECAHLRAAGREAACIDGAAAGILATAQRITADHVVTEAEERELIAEIVLLCKRSRRHAATLDTRNLPGLDLGQPLATA